MGTTERIQIIIEGKDHASGALNTVKGALGGVATVAAGMLTAQSITAIARQVADLGRQALDAVASYERLSMSMESLMAREIMRTSGTERIINLGMQEIQLTEAQQGKLHDLSLTLRQLQIDYEQAQQSMFAKQEGGDFLGAEEMAIRMERLQGKIADVSAEMEGLQGREGELVAITQKVVEGKLSMEEAMQQAGGAAQELLDWITQLAIKSPFDQEGVAIALRTAMAYGFTSDQAKRLTTAMIDFTAATGAGTPVMNQIALALGQVQARGKLMGQEILQLVNAGVPVLDILAQHFGKTTAEVQKMVEQGLVPADQAIEAIVSTIENEFGGAAEKQAETWAGLLNTFGDLKEMGLREFFGGILRELQPLAVEFANWLQSDGLNKAKELGETLGDFTGHIIDIGRYLGIAAESGDWFNDFLTHVPANIQPIVQKFGEWASHLQPIIDFFAQFKENAPNLELQGQVTAGVDMGSAADWQAAFPTPPPTLGEAFMNIIPEGLRDDITDIVEAIGRVAQALEESLPEIKDQFATLTGQIEGVFGEDFWSTILGNTEGGTNALADLWSQHGTKITGVLMQTLGWIVGYVAGFLVIVSGLFAGALQMLSGDWEGGWNTIKESFNTFANIILGLMGTNLDELRQVWQNNFEMLLIIASEVWFRVNQAVIETFATIFETITTKINEIIAWFSEQFTRFYDIGLGIVEGIKEGILGGWSAITDAIRGLVDGIFAAAEDQAKMKSPSRRMFEWASLLLEGGELGIKANAPGLIGAARDAADMVVTAATPTAPAMVGATGGGTSITFNINGAQDPRLVADEIARKLRLQGVRFNG